MLMLNHVGGVSWDYFYQNLSKVTLWSIVAFALSLSFLVPFALVLLRENQKPRIRRNECLFGASLSIVAMLIYHGLILGLNAALHHWPEASGWAVRGMTLGRAWVEAMPIMFVYVAVSLLALEGLPDSADEEPALAEEADSAPEMSEESSV